MRLNLRGHYLRLCYTLLHKYLVLKEGVPLGVPIWMLLLHDWDKFLPDEWFPYVDHFHGSQKVNDPEFELALQKHTKRNKHHWEHWVIPAQNGCRGVTLDMPDVYRREMLADWRAVGRTDPSLSDRERYLSKRRQIVLHANTRKWIEERLKI
jgi:hypothetical protein